MNLRWKTALYQTNHAVIQYHLKIFKVSYSGWDMTQQCAALGHVSTCRDVQNLETGGFFWGNPIMESSLEVYDWLCAYLGGKITPKIGG